MDEQERLRKIAMSLAGISTVLSRFCEMVEDRAGQIVAIRALMDATAAYLSPEDYQRFRDALLKKTVGVSSGEIDALVKAGVSPDAAIDILNKKPEDNGN